MRWIAKVLTCILLTWTAVSPGQSGPHAPSSGAVFPGKFADITASSGVVFSYQSSKGEKKFLIETMGAGVALFDYDNDGRLDIFLVNGASIDKDIPADGIPTKSGPAFWNRLFHQKQDGSFEDVTEKAGLQGFGYGMGVAVGDYDNDGFEDLFVTAYGGNRLYHNNGNGTFTDVTAAAGVAGGEWSTSAAWVDLDNDGRLDLVVLRYMKWDFRDIFCGEHREGYRAYCHPDLFPPIAPLVYHNEGGGRFTDISSKSGLAVPGKGLGIAIADYDRDGLIDIFVANDSIRQYLFHNKGNGTFEEVGLPSETAVDDNGRTYAGMGIDFVDYNNDGWPDAIITDLGNQKYALYRNRGDGTFDYTSNSSSLGRITQLHSGWGVKFLDYDNDGWRDLLIAQGHDLDTVELQYPQLRYREPLLLARNVNGKFMDVSAESGAIFQKAIVGRGLAIGDLDNDGRMDAVVTTSDGPIYILHNETVTRNHWLTLKLVGHSSNRDAIGAEVEITTPSGKQLATVSTAGSYLSSSDKRVHFGLGPDTHAQLKIRWPSGIVQELKDVSCDRELTIDEPAKSPVPGEKR